MQNPTDPQHADEGHEKYLMLSREDFHRAVSSRTCPLDGNPRHPGLNRELFCSCGFAITT